MSSRENVGKKLMSEFENEAKVDQLLSVEAVARILGVSRRSIYRLVASGDIRRPVAVGKCSRFPASEIREYVERLKAARPEQGLTGGVS